MREGGKVLAISRDPAIRRLLAVLLETGCHRVSWAQSLSDGSAPAVESRPDIIVLDLDPPGAAGVAVVGSLREWTPCPILVLSTQAAAADKAAARDAGANDYLVKPFEGIEFLARLRALLRRDCAFAPDACLDDGILRVSLATRQVSINGRRVGLTATEEAVFYILARHAGAFVTSRQCARAIWGSDAAPRLRELRVYVDRLRRKLETPGSAPVIKSIGRAGYSLTLGARQTHGLANP